MSDIKEGLFEFIESCVFKILSNIDSENKNIVEGLRFEIEEELDVIKDHRKKIDIIQKSISEHSIGVQNVYNEFLKIQKYYKISDDETIRTKIKDIQKNIDKILDIIDDD